VAAQRADKIAKQTNIESGVSTPSISNSSLCSSVDSQDKDQDQDQDQDLDEAKDYHKVIAKKYNLHVRRFGTMVMDERNLDLELMMTENPVVIFPSKHVQAWDHMPRF
jgi:hypothetical protein